MGNICGSTQPGVKAEFAADETNHGSGWGVPPPPRKKDPEAATISEKKDEVQASQQRRKSSIRPKSTGKDMEKLKAAIVQAMKREGYDAGSLGPSFIRLAWHSCGTYDKETKTGGSSAGATMRFAPESEDEDNAGLHVPREALAPVQAQFPWISHADLWILAGTLAIKEMGGPEVEVKLGRKDHPGPTSPIPAGRLPKPELGEKNDGGLEEGTNRIKGWERLAKHMRETFERMGFTEQEMVALICGGHVFGQGHRNFTGYQGAWVENPLEFSNEYAADLIDDEWRFVDGSSEKDQKEIPAAVCPMHGKRQYVSKPFDEHPQMMLPSDMVLLWDESMRVHTKRYAEDEDALRTEFAAAWKKLIELGCEGILDK